jgi:hypothetical protein
MSFCSFTQTPEQQFSPQAHWASVVQPLVPDDNDVLDEVAAVELAAPAVVDDELVDEAVVAELLDGVIPVDDRTPPWPPMVSSERAPHAATRAPTRIAPAPRRVSDGPRRCRRA